MYYLYILLCSDSTLYTGITVDLSRRVAEHNSSSLGAKYTHARRPVTLVYSKRYPSRSLATIAEMKIKKLSREEKIKLINSFRLKIKAFSKGRSASGGKNRSLATIAESKLKKLSREEKIRLIESYKKKHR